MSEVVEETPALDTLVPPNQKVDYTFGVDGHLTYTQRPLSFFGKIELFSILGTAVEGALSGGGVSVADLIDDVPTGDASNFKEADSFVKSIAKLVQYVPDLLKDLYVIALGVPREEREYVKSVMELPETQGGLTDDQGIQILEVFIAQNWDVLLDFFKSKLLPLFNDLMSRGSASSKPSKATAQATARQSKKSSPGPGNASK